MKIVLHAELKGKSLKTREAMKRLNEKGERPEGGWFENRPIYSTRQLEKIF